ncbi:MULTISPECIES: hypothetical protein [Bacillaceae]|uniref:hypothetical protein n=1 Tax=Bacillaceae TaxID=186817 RepID=UPI001F43483F|nr:MULTISPECIES: hypothetical protein [Bacillaceae]
MKIEVKLTDKNKAYIIKNLYPLCLYDLANHYDLLPNIHGIYEEGNEFKTLSDQYDVQQV